MSPLIVLSTPPPFSWLPDLDLMVGMTSCGLHIFTSLGVCVFIFLGTLSHNFLSVKAISPEDAAKVEDHLLLGREFLARGQYSDALSQYHAAVEGDPENYLTIFKRATVYLALGRSKAALKDLDRVVELKPDFVAARLQRGNILIKQGELDIAHIEFEWVLRYDPYNEEANHHYSNIEPLKQDLLMADMLYHDRNYMAAIEIYTKIIQECPWSPILREKRADSLEAIGDLGGAIADLRSTVKQTTDNTVGWLKLSKLLYKSGDAEESLIAIRECLKLDPDHKDCFTHYKNVKKVAASLKSMQQFRADSQYNECAEKGESSLKLVKDSQLLTLHVKAKICHCLNKAGSSTEAIASCSEYLKNEPDDVNVLCDRAEAYINLEQFDDALSDYQRASNIDEHSQRARDGLKRAQKLQKQSKKRNYYQILGVSRTATKKEIMKAYRRVAAKWHPDNYNGDEKKVAEKKFIDIAAAKEVLTDPEKRQQFDNGEDPLDPESQAGQNFNPFAHGFHPFENGGPFTFKFHFN